MNSPSKPKTHIPNGLFIVLEGGEGAGKTSAAAYLQKYFQELGYDVIVTREPGATTLGKKLREVLLDPDFEEDGLDGHETLLLFSADRHAHIRKVIQPALSAGKIVISDRYVLSTQVYQAVEGVPVEDILAVTKIATNDLMPTRTYWFDVAPHIGLQRIAAQNRSEQSKYDEASLAFHNRLYLKFREYAEVNPEQIKRIDASENKSEVQRKIRNDIYNLISDKLDT